MKSRCERRAASGPLSSTLLNDAPCRDFAALLRALHPSDSRAPVAYLQSQNSNLTAEAALQPLHADLLGDSGELPFAWATEALGKEAEAVNVWIGTQRSRTSLHRDHYENLFHVVRGEKTFILYAPTERFFLCEGAWRRLPPRDAPH